MMDKKHRHNYREKGTYLICDCGKRILKLEPSNNEGLLIGKQSSGKTYSVRDSRKRYFFPDEWIKFNKTLTNSKHLFFYTTLLHTGARIMEALHIKYGDINIDRGTIKLRVVKQRKAKRNFYATGTSREFFVASNYIKSYKVYIRGKKIDPDKYIFLNNDKLPKNYDNLTNKEKMKYYQTRSGAYSRLFKRKLKEAGIEDYWNFSPHNIRKTYGNWMRTLKIEIGELCYRLGHDLDTYLAHYGSSLIFTPQEVRKIENIFGDVK